MEISYLPWLINFISTLKIYILGKKYLKLKGFVQTYIREVHVA